MNKEISDAFNCIIEFLAVRDIAQMSKDALKQACGASVTDVIIALGSDLPVVAETACELYKAGYGEKLMFCGGIGHSTVNLKKKVAKILNVETDQLPESEAEIYACLAKDKYQIESSSIFMDKTSTNTSENIKNNICRHALLLCVSVRKGTTKRKDYNDRNRLCVTSWRRYQ